MQFKPWLLAATLLGISVSAAAQMHGSLDYNFVTYKTGGLPQATLGMLGANLARDVHKNLAIEGRFALGVLDDQIAKHFLGITVRPEYSYGIYLKPRLALTPKLEIYGKLGLEYSKVKVGALGWSDSLSGSDTAYGVGLQYAVDQQLFVKGGYTSLYDKDGIEIDNWDIGLGYAF